ncbi:MAG: 1-acyl-sn-glycerol-3-phosphate acyltransferase, partial [Acidobacteriota bacterium]
KIKRFQLKKEVESGEIAAETKEIKAWEMASDDTALMTSKTAGPVIAAIKQNAKDVDTIHPKMNLEIDLGLDSLARAETFAALEQAFGTEFETDEASQALTVSNVIELVNSHVGEDAESVSVDLNWGKIIREADDDFPELRSVLANRWFFAAFAFTLYKCFWLIFKVFLRLEVKGLKELNEMKQPFLVCPNHQSFLDPFVLCSNYNFALFKNVFHVGASEFFVNKLMQFIARMLNVVPVNPDTELMRAMKISAIGLKHGKVLNIYPEGERAFDGELHGFKKGAAILATELDLPIFPVAMDGLYKVWARNSWKIRPAKVKITIGKPFFARDVLKDEGGKMKAEAMPASSSSLDSSLIPHSSSLVGGDGDYELVTAHLKQIISDMIDEMRK